MKQIKRRSAYFSRQARAKPGSCFEFVGISNLVSSRLGLLVIKGVSPGSLREAHRRRLPVRTAGAETGRGMDAVGLGWFWWWGLLWLFFVFFEGTPTPSVEASHPLALGLGSRCVPAEGGLCRRRAQQARRGLTTTLPSPSKDSLEIE